MASADPGTTDGATTGAPDATAGALHGSAVTAGPLRLRPLLAATPAAVWWVVVLQVLLGLVYGAVVPVMHGPDEYAHVDRVLGEPVTTVDPGLTDRADAAIARQGLTRLDWRVAPSQATDVVVPEPREERPAWQELGSGASIGEINQAYDHPPTYYGVAAAFDRVVEPLLPSGRWDLRIGRVRALSALMLAPLPWLAYWVLRRLRDEPGLALAAALLPTTLPMLAQSGATVSNDAMVTTLGGFVTMGAVWIATGDDSVRTGVLTGLAGGLAAATKIFGFGAPAWILAAVVGLRLVAGRWPGLRWWVATAVAGVVGGAWWPLSRLLLEGTAAPRRFAYELAEAPDTSVVTWLGEAAVRLPRTTISLLGVEQFGAPDVVTFPAMVLLVGLGVVGIVRLRSTGVVLAAPVATSLAMIAWASWQAYLLTGITPGLRGRYLFVGVVGIAVLALVPTSTEPAPDRHGRRWQVGAVVLLGVVLHATTLVVALDGLWAGDGSVASLRTALVAAPLGRPLTLAAALLAVVALVAAVVSRSSRSPAGRAPATPPAGPGPAAG